VSTDERTLSSEEQATLARLPVDQLSFLDLLYAVPVADLAMRVSGAELHRVPLADWLALAVILATIVLSWIGLHKNRAAMATTVGRTLIGQIDFLQLRFIQFLIEVAIVGLYFTMGLELRFPTSQSPAIPAAPEEWITAILVLVFAAYLVWDLIDIWEARGAPTWCGQAKAGTRVTLVFLTLSAGFYVMAFLTNHRAGWTVALLNIGLIVFLWAYRVAQDKLGNTRETR
jgi:hypothetical protein